MLLNCWLLRSNVVYSCWFILDGLFLFLFILVYSCWFILILVYSCWFILILVYSYSCLFLLVYSCCIGKGEMWNLEISTKKLLNIDHRNFEYPDVCSCMIKNQLIEVRSSWTLSNNPKLFRIFKYSYLSFLDIKHCYNLSLRSRPDKGTRISLLRKSASGAKKEWNFRCCKNAKSEITFC